MTQPAPSPEMSGIERRLVRLAAFEEVSRAIGASLDLTEICRRALAAALRVVEGRSGGIYRVDWHSRQIKLVAAAGFPEAFLEQFAIFPLDERTLAGRAALQGKPQLGTTGSLPLVTEKVAAEMGTRGFLVVPISSRGKVLGTLSVVFGPSHRITDEVDLLANLAGPIGVAMDNARLHSQTVELSTRLLTASLRLRTLLDAAEEINSPLELGKMLRRIVELAAQITGATEGFVAPCEEEQVVMREWWDSQVWKPMQFAWQKGAGCPGQVYLTGKPYVSQDVRSDPHVVPRLVETMKLRNVIVAPMLSREGEFLGVIEVGNKSSEAPFTEEDIELVTAFSRLAAVAFQNGKLMSDINTTAHRRKAIGDVALAVSSGASLKEVLRIAIDRLTEALAAAVGSIFLLDPDGRRLRGVVATAEIGQPVETAEIDLKETLATRRALRRKEPIFVDREEAHIVSQPRLAAIGAVQFIAVPLVAAGKPIGVAYLTYNQPRKAPSSEEMDFIRSLALQCAIAIEKARLLEEARTQRQRLESIVEQMPGGVTIGAAPENRVIFMNRRMRAISGKAMKVGMPVTGIPEKVGLYHANGRAFAPEETALYRALVLGEVVRGIELTVVRPARKPKWLLGRAVPLRDENGRIREAVAVIEDITPLKEARQRAEEAARLAQGQKAELETIIDSMAEGVLIADPPGNVLRVNRAAAKILGFKSIKDVYPRLADFQAWDVCDPQGRPLPMEKWASSKVFREEAFTEQEIVVTVNDGRRRNLLVGGSAGRSREGKPTMAIVVFRDITAIRDLERQREEFISVVAHDLRSALTIVKGGSQILLRPDKREGLPAESLKLVEAIHLSSRRLERMVFDLLDVSRIEARRLKLEKRRVDLPALVRSAVDQSVELTKGHPVKVDIRGLVPEVAADPDRVQQILINLLSNAAKYSFPETVITVQVTPGETEVQVSVTNLGVGVRVEDRQRLFTRFHRTKVAAGEQVPGLGLGLYISKGLVEAHGGKIWVESEPGKFVTFCFTLPK
ncbi:MAG: GAF domain-containing protein [Chloroflexi bacterium]|nr:GAF domain-containing protein [Chloroflexota bacterium]